MPSMDVLRRTDDAIHPILDEQVLPTENKAMCSIIP